MIFEKGGGGVHLRSTSKKGGGSRRGPILGPMLKSLHSGQKGGIRTPSPPRSAHEVRPLRNRNEQGIVENLSEKLYLNQSGVLVSRKLSFSFD